MLIKDNEKNSKIAKEFIESVGCELLSDYINARTNLLIKCKNCENTFYRTFDNFKRQKSYLCRECSMKALSIKTKERVTHDIEWVKQYVINRGSQCFSNEYNPYIPLKIKCNKCGVIHERLLSVIKLGSTLCKRCGRNRSGIEYELQCFIKSLNIDYVFNNRKVINPLELDVYIPSKKLAIEFDGIYWHSELRGKDKNYHLNKTKLCEEKDVQLLHIFENEWIVPEKRKIIESIILSKLNLTDKIYARKCKIRELSSIEKNKFLVDNHIQGNDRSKIRLGLFYNSELVSLMTFSKSRFDKNVEWEMTRFCNKRGLTVVGGASRLLKFFTRKYNPLSIISYADKRFSNGNVYNMLGFKYSHESNPNYFYFKGKYRETLMPRQNFQKHKLSKVLKSFNPEMTEWENMKINGFNRIWDCGNKVYKLTL